MSIRVEHLSKNFGSFEAVKDVSFEVRTGELVALLGPSGGGKSTILRIIAGLENEDAGTVRFDGEPVGHLHARARKVGFVFQHYALFRHMTVTENVAFGLRAQGVARSEAGARAAELLRLVGLDGLGKRVPSQLSGGQRQRVALARALAPRPRLLLLDEPFAAIDAKVRQELRVWLRRLHDEMHVTSIFVTHDQEEAFALADRVLVINNGKLEQAGTPLEIMDEPATEFVAGFVGEVNVIDGIASEGSAVFGGLRVPTGSFADGAPVRVVIRSYDLKFWRDDSGIATVSRMQSLGDRVKVEARFNGSGSLFAQFPRRSSLLAGMEPGCRIAVEVTKSRAYPLVVSG
ncbi:MAG: sulfate ABC transporter ATP-binding protein [Anaerolineae bacterium]|nr:sulfate ABC transporter ATP-binding protein [Gemmatimonadaceae bacterium]